MGPYTGCNFTRRTCKKLVEAPVILWGFGSNRIYTTNVGGTIDIKALSNKTTMSFASEYIAGAKAGDFTIMQDDNYMRIFNTSVDSDSGLTYLITRRISPIDRSYTLQINYKDKLFIKIKN